MGGAVTDELVPWRTTRANVAARNWPALPRTPQILDGHIVLSTKWLHGQHASAGSARHVLMWSWKWGRQHVSAGSASHGNWDVLRRKTCAIWPLGKVPCRLQNPLDPR